MRKAVEIHRRGRRALPLHWNERYQGKRYSYSTGNPETWERRHRNRTERAAYSAGTPHFQWGLRRFHRNRISSHPYVLLLAHPKAETVCLGFFIFSCFVRSKN